jgi:sugar/nucleoside kinase (ribokinase family)
VTDLDVLVLNSGRVYLDILFGNVERLPEPGEELHYDEFAIQPGGAYNTAAGLARLGLSTALAADLGSDRFSDYLFDEIARAGVRTDFVRRVPRPILAVTVSLSGRSDRRLVSYSDPAPETPLPLSVLDEYGFRHVHLPGYRQASEVLDFVAEARRRGSTISVDSQSDVGSLTDRKFGPLVPYIDTLFCNRREARLLAGLDGEEQAARELARHVGRVVVKLGEGGALAAEGDRVVRVPLGIDVDARDTTGAGDAFAAGFLFGALRGLDLAGALAAGNLCGASSTTRLGSSAGFPDERELRELLAARGIG